LALSVRIPTVWRTVLVAGCFVSLAGLCVLMIVWLPRHNRKLREANRKVSRLQYLVYGKRRGWVLIGKRRGKRVILWPRIFVFTVIFWLVMSLIGAGVYYLLCGGWAYSIRPAFHILVCTAVSIIFILMFLHEGLKTPIEELVEIGDKHDASPGKWLLSNYRIFKLGAASAVILLAVIIGFNMLDGEPTWAMVMQAFDRVEYIHATQKIKSADGNVMEVDVWLKKPNYVREEYIYGIVIDNGRERLEIDKQQKTAQFSDSHVLYKPLEEHHAFKSIQVFRGADNEDVTFEKIDVESNKTTLVYRLYVIAAKAEGKAWVDAKTMLPLKIEFEIPPPPYSKNEKPSHGELAFDYSPIADSKFEMMVPDGYTLLPRKELDTLSGKVLDQEGKPVASAVVNIADRSGNYSDSVTTNGLGEFAFVLPPEGTGVTPLLMPVFFKAFVEKDLNYVAWSVVQDPTRQVNEPGSHIPCEMNDAEYKGSTLVRANGLILRMEPAGSITGLVTNAKGDVMPGVKVRVNSISLADKWGHPGQAGIDMRYGIGPKDKDYVLTDSHGRYRLNHIPRFWKGTGISIKAEVDSYMASIETFQTKGPIDVEEVNLRLYQDRLTVSGILLDNYGKPLENAPVFTRIEGKWHRHGPITKTDQDGHFKLEGCPDSPDLKIWSPLGHGFSPEDDKTKVFYPSAEIGVDYRDGQAYYDVQMVTMRPELTLHVTVKNTKGEILPYFPVEIRAESAHGLISTEWKVQKHFSQRTDANGCCTFKEVPDMDGLKLVLWAGNSVPYDTTTDEVRKIIADYEKNYFWVEVPVEVVEGQKNYTITAVALTHEEWEKQRDSRKGD